MSNPYEFKDLENDIYSTQLRPELLVDSILVFVYRVLYMVLCSSAYIAYFLFNSVLVAKTIAIITAFLSITDLLAMFLLVHLATSRSKLNKKIIELHNNVTGNK